MSVKKIVVVGAGLGGLTATLALRRAGHEVVLLERDAEPRAVGAGLMLGHNAVACLDALGLREPLRQIGRPMPPMAVTDPSGRVLQALDLSALGLEVAGLTVDRGALHRVLHEAAGACRGHAQVASVDEGGVTLADGTREAADLVVGADGLYSAVRTSLGSRSAVRYSGQTCWRLLAPDVLSRQGPVERWGPGVRVGWVPLSEGRMYGYLVADAPAGTCDTPTPREALIERFAAFGPEVRAVLEAAPRWVHHDLCELDVHDWGRGRVVLLGDAAHGMTPNLGQGAAMAIEDGWTLPQVVSAPDPSAALQALRAGRVSQIARAARLLGWMAHWRSPTARWVRDTAMTLSPAALARHSIAGLLLGGPISAR
jgi:2-polyprenyl-6-methoxyphenol hydroxylase-like FAD-dependent oxidoreductase